MMNARGPSRLGDPAGAFFAILRFFHQATTVTTMTLTMIEQMENRRSALKTVQNPGLVCIYLTIRH